MRFGLVRSVANAALILALPMAVTGCTEAETARTDAPNVPGDAGPSDDVDAAGGEPLGPVPSFPYGLATELEDSICTGNIPGFWISLAEVPRSCGNWAVVGGTWLDLSGDFRTLAVGTYDIADADLRATYRPDPHTIVRGESGWYEIVEIQAATMRVRWDIVLEDGRRTEGDVWVELCADSSAKCI